MAFYLTRGSLKRAAHTPFSDIRTQTIRRGSYLLMPSIGVTDSYIDLKFEDGRILGSGNLASGYVQRSLECTEL